MNILICNELNIFTDPSGKRKDLPSVSISNSHHDMHKDVVFMSGLPIYIEQGL